MDKLLETSADQKLHLVFEVSLLFKFAYALLETVLGTAIFFAGSRLAGRLIIFLSQDELTESPHDFLTGHFLTWLQNLSVGSQHFIAVYLLAHGLMKIILVLLLVKGRRRFYLTGMILLSIFVIYQLLRFTHTHSLWLLFATCLDVVILELVWLEYRRCQV